MNNIKTMISSINVGIYRKSSFNLFTRISYEYSNLSKNISLKSVVSKDFSIEKISIINESLDLNKLLLDNNEVGILTDSCPINPLDLQKISGKIKEIKLPFVLGSECSGVIIKTGQNNTHLLGKKVAASVSLGSYKSFNVAKDSDIIIYPDDSDMTEISMGFINPITSNGLISLAQQYSPKSVVNTAAASALGKMIIRLCKLKKINCINIVRSENSLNELKKEFKGELIVLNSSDNNFVENFKKITDDLSATICFDCVGGNMTGTILNTMPNNSTSVIYGSLDSEYLGNVNGIMLRRKNQSIRGFILYNWWGNLNAQERETYKTFVVDNFSTIFKTKIGVVNPIECVKDSLNNYKNNMSGGKFILKF